jgi:putative flippase GtrA
MIRHTALEALRFTLVGGTVALLHLVFVYFLTSILGWWYLYSVIFSYTGAIMLNFTLQKFFVRKNHATEKIKSQFVAYAIISVGFLGINTLIMYLFVSIFLWQYLVSQALVIFTLSALTFLINRHFIFR